MKSILIRYVIQRIQKEKAAAGFEPANNGFANRRLRPLGYAAKVALIIAKDFGFGKTKAMGIYHLECLGDGYGRPEKRNLGNKSR